MESVHEAVEHHVGEVFRIVVADAEPREQLLALPVDFFSRKRRVLRNVGHQVEPEGQAVLHHHGIDKGEIGSRAGAQRAAD